MIGPLGFAARNLKRRGFHSFLAFTGLTLCLASTTFLLLAGLSLAARFSVDSYAQLTFGIARIILGYLLLSLILILLVGMLSISYLVSSMINQRMRDVGVINAAGSLPGRLRSYAVTEALVIVFSSCWAGALIALAVYWSWTGLFLQSTGLAGSSNVSLILFGVPILFFVVSYIAAAYRVRKILNIPAANAFSSQLSTLDLKSLGKPLHARRLGSPFNLATRNVSRDGQFTRTIARVTICILLVMIVFTAAFVAADTSKSYLQRAMPSHVLILAAPNMYNSYLKLGTAFSSPASIPNLDYLNRSYIISPSLADSIRRIPGVVEVDTRLMTVSTVTGFVIAHLASSENTGENINTQIIPEISTGSATALIVGVNPNNVLGDWYASNGFLQNGDPQNTMIAGDSLTGSIVQFPLNLSQVGAFGMRFNVKSALVDPLNAGRVLYASVQSLQNILGVSGYNLLLVSDNNDPMITAKIAQLASVNGLVVGSQDTILNANLAFLDHTWSYLYLLPILTLVLTCSMLLGYLTTSFSRRFNDYVVLRVLGAGKWYTLKLLLWEGWGVFAICLAIALPVAILISTIFIVPDPSAGAGDIILSSIASISALTIVSVASATIYSRRLRQATVKDLRL